MSAIAWNPTAGTAFLGVPGQRAVFGAGRCIVYGEHDVGLARSARLSSAAQANSSGVAYDLPSRNQPCVANGDPDSDGPVRVDEPSTEKRAEQGRLSCGCAQQDPLYAHHQLLQGRRF